MQAPEIILVLGGIVLAVVLSTIVIMVLRGLGSEVRSVLGRVLFSILVLVVFIPLLVLPPVWLIAAFVIVEMARRYRAAQQYALLWQLVIAAERSMPLSPAVAAFARERGGDFSRRTRRLAEMLNAGVPLPDALQRIGGLLPPYAVSMVRVGAESGALAPALRQAATVYDLQAPIWLSLFGKIFYLTLVPAFGTLILIFIMLKIVPQYQKIFADFGASLPPMTCALVSVSQCFCYYWYILVLPLLLLLFYAVMRYWGWVQWDLPGMARLVRRFDSAQLLDSLSLVARQQRPLSEGIASLARSYPKRDIRRRLRKTEADIRGGRDWCESLRARGLIQAADLAILQAAQRVGNLAWALHEMADSGRRRLVYRVQAIIQTTFPLVVVFLGLTVMFIMVALFLPLVSLIQRMAGLQ